MSIKRWHAYIEDDDGNDLFVSHLQDAQGQWVRYDDHAAEVERLQKAVAEAAEPESKRVATVCDALVQKAERERDEARDEVERLKAKANWLDAEAERLIRERDDLASALRIIARSE